MRQRIQNTWQIFIGQLYINIFATNKFNSISEQHFNNKFPRYVFSQSFNQLTRIFHLKKRYLNIYRRNRLDFELFVSGTRNVVDITTNFQVSIMVLATRDQI